MHARIFQHTYLELSHEMYSKNMQHALETFLFSNPAKGHCVHDNKILFLELEEQLILFGENKTWKFAEQSPSCKNFDLFDHFKDLNNYTPQIIWFKFKLLHNLSVSLFIEERNKQASRTIKAHRLMYIGPTLVMRNMSVSFLHSTVLREAPLMKNTQMKNTD